MVKTEILLCYSLSYPKIRKHAWCYLLDNSFPLLTQSPKNIRNLNRKTINKTQSIMKIKNTSQLKELAPLTNFEKTGSRAKKRSKIGSIRLVKIRLA